MVRVRSAIVVRHMTGITIRWRSRIAARMALIATGIHMLARKGEACVAMIKGGGNPGRLAMTLRTICREAQLRVVRRYG